VKYWTCNALVLCGALIVSDADKPNHLASWHPLFLVATVNVVFSEKVVGTVSLLHNECLCFHPAVYHPGT